MYLSNLKATNFKSYEDLDADFCGNLNCLVGNNGVGKTNLLEAVYYLSFCKGCSGGTDVQNVRRGESFFAVHGRYVTDHLIDGVQGGMATVSCVYKTGEAKQMKWNGRTCKTLREHIGRVPLVMVSPQDQGIITEGSEIRRRFVDGVISQTDGVFLDHLLKYSRALEQRNKLLRLFAEERSWDEATMNVWEEQLVQHGEALRKGRELFFEDFTPLFKEYYEWITGGGESGELEYVADRERPLSEMLQGARQRDRVALYTTVGPHRDDVELRVGEMMAKRYGSQGQQKTFVLALKLAQFEYMLRRSGVKPILLLDDVFDKLDMMRVKQLVQLAGSDRFGQVFLTDTQPGRVEQVLREIPQTEHVIYEVERGKLQRK